MKTYTRQTAPTPEPKPAPLPAPVAGPPVAGGKEYRELEEGAQWTPAPQPPTLTEILPAEYATTRPPLLYRLAKVSEPSKPDGRIAESRTYRAKAFSCGVFYKPISRILVDWEDR